VGLFVIQPCSMCDYTYMYYTQRPEGNSAYHNDPLCSGTTINFEVLRGVTEGTSLLGCDAVQLGK